MKRAVVVVVVLLCLLFVADLLLRAAAENAAATFIDKRIAEKVEPEVGLGGFPFLASLLSGSFDEVTVAVPQATKGLLVAEDIRLTFVDVKLEALEVLAGRGDLRAESLTGRAVISEQTVNQIVNAQAPELSVTIEDDKVVVSRGEVSVPATAVVVSNTLHMSANEVIEPIEVPLPDLIPEIKFTSLEAREGRLVLGIRAARIRLRP